MEFVISNNCGVFRHLERLKDGWGGGGGVEGGGDEEIVDFLKKQALRSRLMICMHKQG